MLPWCNVQKTESKHLLAGGLSRALQPGKQSWEWYRQGHLLVKGIGTPVSCCFKSFPLDEVFVGVT